MQDLSSKERAAGKKIVLVPTMGYLHEGHLSLLKEGRTRGDLLVMSLFVNPLQFGPREDLAQYPRDLERDKKLAESAGTDVIFSPDSGQMYPRPFRTSVEVSGLSDLLCGRTRPGHFRGVATVVLKLFNIVLPQVALFGEKDFQQLVIIRQMVRDLNVPVEIIGMPVIRESDGLAKSSRNVYLSAGERRQALSISRGLLSAADTFQKGNKNGAALTEVVRREMQAAGLKEDYVEIIDESTLEPVHTAGNHARIVVAAYAGGTRLIDNVSLGDK